MIIVRNKDSRYLPDQRVISITLPDEPCPVNYVSLDIETATTQGDICQLGLAVFHDGQIVEEKSYLIRPPEDHYDYHCSKVHGFFSGTTKHQPFFPEYWPEIQPYLSGRVLVCHNASFDLSALSKTMEKYGLGDLEIEQCIDTCVELGHCPLYSACLFFNVPLKSHHDALEDARACGLVLQAYSKMPGQVVSIPVLTENKDIKLRAPEVVLQSTPFSGKSVVVSGIFQRWPDRNELALKLMELGALVKTSVSKKTNFLITGFAPGESKVSQAEAIIEEGYSLRIITEEEFVSMLGEE